MMRKTGAERLIIGCQMADTARALVWSGIPQDLPESERRKLFLQRFYGLSYASWNIPPMDTLCCLLFKILHYPRHILTSPPTPELTFKIDIAISILHIRHMQRTTILLPEDLHRKASKEARTQGISLSELIRQRLTDCVKSEQPAKPAFFSRQPWTGNGADDVATRHDDYLYGQ